MKKNVGTIDRIIRLVAAALLLYMGFLDNPIVSAGTFKIVIGIFGVLILFSAFLEYCPLYLLVDLNTRCNKQD